MSKRDEHYSAQFHRWEMRGRGLSLYPQPVALEPVFVPFSGYSDPPRSQQPVDDGRRHTALSGLFARLQRQVVPPPKIIEPEPEEQRDPDPEKRESEERVELQLSLPLSRSVPTPQVETFIRHVARAGEPLVLEILGTDQEIVPQWVASPRAAMRVRSAVETCFPGLVCAPFGGSAEAGGALRGAWHDSEQSFAVVELGLGREFMLPLGNPRCDLLASVTAAMDVLEKGELALFQVMFEPVRGQWSESVVRAVTDDTSKPFFTDRSDLVRGAELKTTSPLFGVVVRLVSSAAEARRAWEIIADMAAALSALSRPGSNYLVPLANEGYPIAEHEEEILNRLSRRSGMLLSLEEVIPLITPPATAVSPKLRRETKRSHAAPDVLRDDRGLFIGCNPHAGATNNVFLAPEHRVRHMHLVGASGTGKSTMLLNLIRQDLDAGEGLAVFDPHGDLVETILGMIPPERVDEVILLDPSDEQFPIGFNILAAHSEFERSLLASDLTSIFRRLSTSWGDQMESVLRNAILAFLESSRGGTLVDLRRFLLDAAFRKEFLQTVSDPEIVFYWERAFPQLTGGKSIGPVMTRLDEFLSRKPIRYMVAQDANRLDFAEILDRGRVLLVKLPQGLIGRENTALLGSLITAKLQMAAMNRQRMPAAQRRDFWCYMDEFQNFITPSMAEILAGARKYRLGLILAHQELRQLDIDRDVSSAVLSNCYTRVVFKVGDADARALEHGFSHFEARDVMNLGVGQAVCRVERSDHDFNLSIPPWSQIEEAEAVAATEAAIASSRARYARPRAEVEAELLAKMHREAGGQSPAKKSPAPTQDSGTGSEEKSARAVETVREREKEEDQSALAVSETASVQVPEPAANPAVEIRTNPATLPMAEKLPASPKPPPEFGRGGSEHRAIQQNVKECAEKLGFHVVIEKSVLGGAGWVDVSLEKEDQKIACEISVSRPADDETANLRKCLAAGYEAVIAVASQKNNLIDLARAIQTKLPGEDAKRIHVCLPSRVSSVLKRLMRSAKRSESTLPRSGSYKIRRKFSEHSVDERAVAEEEEFLRAIGRALRGDNT